MEFSCFEWKASIPKIYFASLNPTSIFQRNWYSFFKSSAENSSSERLVAISS